MLILLIASFYASRVLGFQKRPSQLVNPKFLVNKGTFHWDGKRSFTSEKAHLSAQPLSPLPPEPDLESITWIAGGQVMLLMIGVLGISFLSLSPPPTWKLDMETLLNIALFVFPMSIGGLILDRMPGNVVKYATL